MEKFCIMPCIKQKVEEQGFEGYTVPLISMSKASLIVHFPIPEETALGINFLLNPTDFKSNMKDTKMIEIFKNLGIFKTMTDSLKSSGRFLSGIIVDSVTFKPNEEEIVSVNLYISSSDNGKIEGISQVNFLHGMVLSVMEKIPIILTDNILEKILPNQTEEDEPPKKTSKKKLYNDEKKYPTDQNIVEIAKQIMSGKIK